MYTLRELQKAKNLDVSGRQIKLAVLGNCSTQFFSEAIEGLGRLSGLNITVCDAGYNQIEPQLFDADSEVYKFSPDYILIWMATETLYEEFLNEELINRESFASKTLERIKECWAITERYSNARILQLNFTEYNDGILGQYSGKTPSTFLYQIRKLNYLLEEEESVNRRIFPVDILSVQNNLGRQKLFSDVYYYNAKMTVSMQVLPNLVESVVQVIRAGEGQIKKCVVVDLDDTIWGGIISEVGLAGIEIGELGKGAVYSDLQRWLRQLKQYGIILAVCSKNDEETAKEPFLKHTEMILKLSDIAVFVANWEDKATNIKLIRDTLNIGLDSMIFLDDNPFERNLVRELLPEVLVPELPNDPALWLSYIQEQNYFESVSYAEDSNERTERYQTEFERKKEESRFGSLTDYLTSLEMVCEARPFEESQYPRIAQLTQRSNQFNLRTIRYTSDEIRHMAEDQKYLTFSFSLKDRFGDYGIVSVVILRITEEKELFIDTWIMSCRVLKRSMEDHVMNHVVKMAEKAGFETIESEYIPTNKNRAVEDIYEKMGFSRIGENRYRISIKDYRHRDTFVRG